MINPGDKIYIDDKDRLFSSPKEGRMLLGRYNFITKKPMKEGSVLKISITEEGIKEVERLMKEKSGE